MPHKISTNGIQPQRQLFHNQLLDVYPKNLKFEDIVFWPNNFRTILAFDILEGKKNKSINNISTKEITEFLVARAELELVDLANSILRNGVRVPLIVLDDYTLLDGNRRYFACSYLLYDAEKKQQSRPEVLDKIPVWVIKTEDIDDRIRFKILAEANYTRDYKVEWSDDVKAKVIYDYFQDCLKKACMTEEQTYQEIKDVFGEDKSKIDSYIESIELSNDFINTAPSGKKNDFREHVQGKFLYFSEFRNKAMHGRTILDPKKELPKVKELFFKMMETDRFKNFKQVEPMIRAVHDEYAWQLLSSSQGGKIDQVEVILKEQKAIRSAEDKIRIFLRWLQNTEPNTFSNAATKLLRDLVSFAMKILGKKN